MASFVFSLERVLRFKKQKEKLAEIGVHQAAQALQAVLVEKDRLQNQLAQTAASLEEFRSSGFNLATWLAGYRRAEKIGQEITRAETQEQQAADHLRRVEAQRCQAAREVEALLTLRKNQMKVYKKEANRHEQKILDELSMRRWQYSGPADSLNLSPGEGEGQNRNVK